MRVGSGIRVMLQRDGVRTKIIGQYLNLFPPEVIDPDPFFMIMCVKMSRFVP